jgi:hypothetical protein
VLGFLFGGMTLALVLGYLSTEKARAGKPTPHPGEVVRAAEAFRALEIDRVAFALGGDAFGEALLAHRVTSAGAGAHQRFVEYPWSTAHTARRRTCARTGKAVPRQSRASAILTAPSSSGLADRVRAPWRSAGADPGSRQYLFLLGTMPTGHVVLRGT